MGNKANKGLPCSLFRSMINLGCEACLRSLAFVRQKAYGQFASSALLHGVNDSQASRNVIWSERFDLVAVN